MCTWRPSLKTTLITSSSKHSSLQRLSGLQKLINSYRQLILRNDVVLLLPMEMGNWDSEILHLRCPAVLGVSFESPDLVGDARFCGTLIALSPVADFPPLSYKADSTAHVVHRQGMENIAVGSLPSITREPCGCTTDKSCFSQQHHTDPTTTTLSTVFSRPLLHLLWTFPPNVHNRERWTSHKSCFAAPADAFKTPAPRDNPDWALFWFPSFLCARVSLLGKSGHKKGLIHPQVSPEPTFCALGLYPDSPTQRPSENWKCSQEDPTEQD